MTIMIMTIMTLMTIMTIMTSPGYAAAARDNVVKSSSVQINRSNSAPSFTWISMSKFWLLKKASSSALGKAICLIPFGNMYQIPDPPGFEGYSATRILLPATISPNTV